MEINPGSIHYDPQAYEKLAFTWAVRSDTGKVRAANEDAWHIEPETGLFIVADGMGGHRGGEVASSFVVNDLSVSIDAGFHRLRSTSPRAIRALIKRSVRHLNEQVRMEGDSEAGFRDMGATVVLVLIHAGRATLANVGDSRLYRLREGTLMQLTRDHSVVEELIQAGKLKPEEADNHPAGGMITQYMGMTMPAQPFIRSFNLTTGDRLLLCTDGLTDMLADEQIRNILLDTSDSDSAVEMLIEQANAAGGVDNITAVLIDYR